MLYIVLQNASQLPWTFSHHLFALLNVLLACQVVVNGKSTMPGLCSCVHSEHIDSCPMTAEKTGKPRVCASPVRGLGAMPFDIEIQEVASRHQASRLLASGCSYR